MSLSDAELAPGNVSPPDRAAVVALAAPLQRREGHDVADVHADLARDAVRRERDSIDRAREYSKVAIINL